MKAIDWDSVQERQEGEFDNPPPGGYIAVITGVRDNEEKEYLEIQWDYTQPPYIGTNADTFARAGFWPTVLFRSYKPKALPFFKSFKTALEGSNPGFRFEEKALDHMIGKKIGLVLGEEEYIKQSTGEVKNRLYVYQVRSVKSILDKDFKVPAKKTLPGSAASGTPKGYGVPVTAEESFDDGELPF